MSDAASHTWSISGLRWHGEGTYTVTCSCGIVYDAIAYHADAKRAGAAHIAQVEAGIHQQATSSRSETTS
jgi:hypothetical protein